MIELSKLGKLLSFHHPIHLLVQLPCILAQLTPVLICIDRIKKARLQPHGEIFQTVSSQFMGLSWGLTAGSALSTRINIYSSI